MNSKLHSGLKFGSLLVMLLCAGFLSWVGFIKVRSLSQASLQKLPSDEKFMIAWGDDIKHLERAKSLPAGFQNLHEVKLFATTERLKKAYKKYPLKLQTNSHGKFDLEIFADEIEGGGVVVQYDLVERKSGNTVWELGRTFPHKITMK